MSVRESLTNGCLLWVSTISRQVDLGYKGKLAEQWNWFGDVGAGEPVLRARRLESWPCLLLMVALGGLAGAMLESLPCVDKGEPAG